MTSDSAVHTGLSAVPTADIIPLKKGMAKRSLRICLLGYRSHPYGGGQGIYLKYLSKALVDAGHKVDVISGEPYPHLDPRVKLIKMPGMNLYENGLASLRPRHLLSAADLVEWFSKLTGGFAEPYCFGRRVVSYLKQHRDEYDLVHDNQSLSYGMIRLQEMGIPLVTTLHHPITSDLRIAVDACEKWYEKILVKRWHSFLGMQKKVVPQLDHIITVSECSQRDIARDFNIPEQDISLVYNGIDTDTFRKIDSVEKRPMRLMATASADAPLKGLRFLLEAYAKLLETYPELELTVLGKPKPDGDTLPRLKRLGIKDKVKFVSGISTEKLVTLYNEASIVVVPSIYEGFGLPAGEAMACETAVVSTNGGALPEVVGDAGVIVEKGNSDAIAEAISELLENPEKRQLLEKAGRERILKRFCWKVAALQMTAYYEKVLADADH